MSLIEIKNMTKKFGNKTAVNDISLSIEKGEIFGLLGPNGAGKSTTINSICGLLKIDVGTIKVDSININDNHLEVKKRLGLVPQEIAIFEELSALDNVIFFGKLGGLKGDLLKKSAVEALEFVSLLDKKNQVPKKFSGGMKRRLNIACAIVHKPKIIIMDEPTVGIDAQSRNHILESVKMLNKSGTTIIYTSHYMEEVESICNRIGIIDNGKLITCGTTEELKSLISNDEKIEIDVQEINYSLINDLKDIPGVKEVALTNNILEIIASQSQIILQDVMFVLSKNGVRIKGIDLIEPDLETVFLSLTGKKLRD